MFEEKLTKDIAKAIHEKGGTAFFVGGKNRNHFMKQMGYPFAEKEDKDIDIEVYSLSKETLSQILSHFGEVDYVGKSFGVFKLKHTDMDIAIPRKEIQAKVLHDEKNIILPHPCTDIDRIEIEDIYPDYKIKVCPEESFGHKDFIVISDPSLPYSEACKRRDFTINSIMINVLSGAVIDPYRGVQDISKGIIRATNKKAFIEDSLRVYRAIQFAARFMFVIDEETKELCKQIDLSSLPKERVYVELEKLLMKSPKPSVGLEYMRELGILRYHPLLQTLVDCQQEPSHHPEGSVWNHTLMVVDEAAKRKEQSKNPEVFMLSALLHDIGKPATTDTNEEGKITFYGHDKKGKELAVAYLKTITDDKKLISDVATLVEHHMKPILYYKSKDTISDGAFRKLSMKVDLKELILLSACDRLGRIKIDAEKEESELLWFKNRCENLHVLDSKPEPIVTGKLLLSLGYKPGVEMGEIIRMAYQIQLEIDWNQEQLTEFILNQYPIPR
jgi:tRNA nucleotidyltransferase (CCA-adding enzyme)